MVFALLFSLVATVQAARKPPEKTRDNGGGYSEDSCSPAYGGCSDSYSSDDDQSSDATYNDRSGTYEGNGRDTGSDSIDGVGF